MPVASPMPSPNQVPCTSPTPGRDSFQDSSHTDRDRDDHGPPTSRVPSHSVASTWETAQLHRSYSAHGGRVFDPQGFPLGRCNRPGQVCRRGQVAAGPERNDPHATAQNHATCVATLCEGDGQKGRRWSGTLERPEGWGFQVGVSHREPGKPICPATAMIDCMYMQMQQINYSKRWHQSS